MGMGGDIGRDVKVEWVKKKSNNVKKFINLECD